MTTAERYLDAVIVDVFQELSRAHKLHPTPMRSAHEGYSIIHEELDELWDDVKDNSSAQAMRKEAIQVAAMAIRFIIDVTLEDQE